MNMLLFINEYVVVY